jgi:CMP-N-acetylneuraminic acid synthetase
MEEERVLGEHTLAHIMSQERSIDIDTPIDLKLAELIMKGEATL